MSRKKKEKAASATPAEGHPATGDGVPPPPPDLPQRTGGGGDADVVSAGDAAAVAETAAPAAVAPPDATIPNVSPPPPDERLVALEKEKEELRNRMLRIAADFENWKKRARKDQVEAEAKAREAVLRDMLEVSDNLERATAAYGATSDPAAVLKGVELVLRLFQSKLDRHEVKPIEAKGQPFDPRIHEAIARVVTTDVPAGSVVVEMQKGYRIGDRLLRPSIVSVAALPEPPAPAEPAPAEAAPGDGSDGAPAAPDGEGHQS